MDEPRPPRRFNVRDKLRVIAQGALFESGWVALHWPGHPRSMQLWGDVDSFRVSVSGHDLSWIDPAAEPPTPRVPVSEGGWPDLRGAVTPLPDDGKPTPYDPRD